VLLEEGNLIKVYNVLQDSFSDIEQRKLLKVLNV
jgi:hypothetical protein